MKKYINKVTCADSLEIMKELPDECVDAIICDPPYGTTACKWDSVIPFELMWEQLNRIIKPNGAIVLFGSEPFSSALRMSNIKNYKYDWTWEKSKVSGFVNSKNKPLNTTENIMVFSLGVTANTKNKYKKSPYNPQGLIRINKKVKNSNRKEDSTIGSRPSRTGSYMQEFTNYPKNIIKIPSESNTMHPTQKPVSLMEYLIKTYTNGGETVLDFAGGSGTTAIACQNLKRNFILIEKEKKYCDIAKERLRQGVLF